LPDEKTHEGESELENELEIEENEVQSLMHQMNVDNIVIVVSDYINIDTRIEVADMIDEGDIITCSAGSTRGRRRGRGKGRKIHNNIKHCCFG
jgi:hypothetical protein